MKTKECRKLDLNSSFLPVEVRPNSTFIGLVTIGTLNRPGSGVFIQLWQKNTQDGNNIIFKTIKIWFRFRLIKRLVYTAFVLILNKINTAIEGQNPNHENKDNIAINAIIYT